MKRTWGTTQLLRFAAACLLLTVSAGIIQAQHLVNSGTFTNNSGGTIKVKGTLTAGQTSYGGTIEFNGTTQTVPAITYTHLKATGASGDKTFAGSTVVTGDITVNQTSGGFVLAATDTLELQKTSTVPVTVTSGSFDVSAGTTKYATGSQVIFGTTYKHLLASNGDKTTSAAVTVANNGSVTNSVTIDFGSFAFTGGTGVTYANTDTLRSAGTVTLASGASINGVFAYNAAGAQTVADATYTGTLSLSGAGTKTVGNVTVSGTYTAAGGARAYDGTFTYNAAGAQSIAGEDYDSLALSGSGTKTFASTTTVGAAVTSSVPVAITGSVTLGASAIATFSDNLSVDGTFDADASSATTVFNGASQTISGTAGTISFANLTLSGTAAKTSSLGLNVAGTFTPTRGIDMGASAVLNITNTAAGAVGSYGSLEMVKGSMRRAIGSTGSTYVMNDSATSVSFDAAVPTNFTLKVEPGTNPTGYTAATHINRKITPSYTGTFSGLTMKLAYLSTEKPSADESKLRFFKSNGNKLSTGQGTIRTASSPTSWGVLTLGDIGDGSSTAVDSELVSGNELIVKNTGAALISIADASWNLTTTWDEGYIPTANDDVEINNAVTITGANAVASTLQVNATKSLNLSASNLTVSGNATNNGTLTIGAAQQLQVGSSGTGTLLNNTGATVVNNGTVIVGN